MPYARLRAANLRHRNSMPKLEDRQLFGARRDTEESVRRMKQFPTSPWRETNFSHKTIVDASGSFMGMLRMLE